VLVSSSHVLFPRRADLKKRLICQAFPTLQAERRLTFFRDTFPGFFPTRFLKRFCFSIWAGRPLRRQSGFPVLSCNPFFRPLQVRFFPLPALTRFPPSTVAVFSTPKDAFTSRLSQPWVFFFFQGSPPLRHPLLLFLP